MDGAIGYWIVLKFCELFIEIIMSVVNLICRA